MRLTITAILIAGVALFSCDGSGRKDDSQQSDYAKWATTLSGGTGASAFYDSAIDSNGNIYAAGYFNGTETRRLGNNVSVTGYFDGKQPLLVKYNAQGKAVWARTCESGTADAGYNGVTVDSEDNIIAAGYITGTADYNLGSQVTVSGGSDNEGDSNVLIVKYDSSGKPLWARSTQAGPGRSVFNCVTVDSNNSVYAAGRQKSGVYIKYGDKLGFYGPGINDTMMLVQYGPNGTPLSYIVPDAGANSDISSVANKILITSDGAVYICGILSKTGNLTFSGPSRSVTLPHTISSISLYIIKFDRQLAPLWGKTITNAENNLSSSSFYDMAAGPQGSIYAVGHLFGGTGFDLGNGIAVDNTPANGNFNTLLVKYSPDGTTQLARTGPYFAGDTSYRSITIDKQGGIVVAGYQKGTGVFDYGNGISAAGPSDDINALVLELNANGEALWARTAARGTGRSVIYTVRHDNSGRYYVSGCQSGTDTLTYGPGVSVTGSSSSGDNAVCGYYYPD